MLTFVTSMTASMAAVHLAIGALDLAEVASLAHRIQGAARICGAMALGRAALVLERFARAGEWSAAHAGATELELQWQLVRNHLAPPL